MAERKYRTAPAKINLVLEVTGRRPDGYHEIDTVLQTLALADGVTLTLGGRPGIHVSGPYAKGTPADDTNLAWRAAQELARVMDRDASELAIELDKQIPPAGGLGGGASDAAAVIRMLGKTWGASAGQQLHAANAIGSDEAFFLAGGTARARGRGEKVEVLPPLRPQPVVLFLPLATIEHKTTRMFAALDTLPFDSGGVAEAFAHRSSRPVQGAEVFNAFERVAFDVFDGLAALWEALESRIGEPVHLAGAGPTLFWIGANASVAARVVTAGSGLPCSVLGTTTAQAE